MVLEAYAGRDGAALLDQTIGARASHRVRGMDGLCASAWFAPEFQVVLSGQVIRDRRQLDRRRPSVRVHAFTDGCCAGPVPTQLRFVAAVAIISGLSAAGAVFVEERLGLSVLQQDLRRTR